MFKRVKEHFQVEFSPSLLVYLSTIKTVSGNWMLIKMHFSMRYHNTQDLHDTYIIFKLLACLTPGFQWQEHVLSKDMKMFFPKKIQCWICQQTSEWQPVLWTWPKPSSSSSTLCVLLIHFGIHLTEKHQHRLALVSSSNSKFFLHNEKVIGLVK